MALRVCGVAAIKRRGDRRAAAVTEAIRPMRSVDLAGKLMFDPLRRSSGRARLGRFRDGRGPEVARRCQLRRDWGSDSLVCLILRLLSFRS